RSGRPTGPCARAAHGRATAARAARRRRTGRASPSWRGDLPGDRAHAAARRAGIRRDRQPDREHGASPDLGVESERAAVALDDRRAGDRQALAGALAERLGREERLEHALADLGRDPGAAIGDGDLDAVAFAARGDPDRAARAVTGALVADRVRRVDDE